VKPLRRVRPNPRDPTWEFPYASRERIEKIRAYFTGFETGEHKRGFHNIRHRSVLPPEVCRKTPWASVAPHFRAQVDSWFRMKVAQERAKKIRGWPTRWKVQSLRMNAAYFGRQVLTRKRYANHGRYARMKRIWLAYKDWEARKQYVAREISRPQTARKLLDIG
jgi:hypothetical protein